MPGGFIAVVCTHMLNILSSMLKPPETGVTWVRPYVGALPGQQWALLCEVLWKFLNALYIILCGRCMAVDRHFVYILFRFIYFVIGCSPLSVFRHFWFYSRGDFAFLLGSFT